MAVINQPGVSLGYDASSTLARVNMQRAGWFLPNVLAGLTAGAGVRTASWRIGGNTKMLVIFRTPVGLGVTVEGTIGDPNDGYYVPLGVLDGTVALNPVNIAGLQGVRLLFSAGTVAQADVSFIKEN